MGLAFRAGITDEREHECGTLAGSGDGGAGSRRAALVRPEERLPSKTVTDTSRCCGPVRGSRVWPRAAWADADHLDASVGEALVRCAAAALVIAEAVRGTVRFDVSVESGLADAYADDDLDEGIPHPLLERVDTMKGA